jgi:hypothetical protein
MIAAGVRRVACRSMADVTALLTLIAWLILFVLCWPLALLALLLWPLIWLVSLPFRLIGITLEAVFALLRGVLFLPARLLSAKRRKVA